MKILTDSGGNIWCVPCHWPDKRDPKIEGQKEMLRFNGVSLEPVLLRKKKDDNDSAVVKVPIKPAEIRAQRDQIKAQIKAHIGVEKNGWCSVETRG